MEYKEGKTRLFKGLTLVEMVLALAIMAVIFAVLAPQIVAIQNGWDSRQGGAEALQNARVLINHLNRNLSQAVRVSAVSDLAATTGYIEFEDKDEDTWRYDVAANYVQFGEVDDLSDLAGPVSRFQITCYNSSDVDTPLDPITDPNLVRFVKLQTTVTNAASRGDDMTFTTQVYIRTNAAQGDCVAAGLVGWWKLDESSGLTAADSSGNGNDGTLDASMNGDEWTTGVVGGALEFDGNDELIRVSGASLNITNEITLSVWVWHSAFRAGQYERYVEVKGGIAIIRKNSDGRLQFYIKTDGTTRHLLVSDVLVEGQWQHVAGTWDGTTQRLYLDGVEIDSQTPGGVLDDPTGDVRINSSGTEYLNGLLDDCRIYNRALTAEEVAELADVLRYREFTEAKVSSDDTSITISTPSDTNEGDLLIVAVATDGDTSSSLAPPGGEGWTEIDVDDYGNEVTLGAWWKLADASESSSHQFTWSGGENAYAWMMRFTGHDTDDPINDVATDGESSSTPESPEVTTDVDGCLILRLGGFDDPNITEGSPGLSGHTAITMDGTFMSPKMYWYDQEVDKIQRANLDGSSIEDLVTAGITNIKAMALDIAGGKMYWADEDVDKIQRANLDGSNIEDLVTAAIMKPRGLALDIVVGVGTVSGGAGYVMQSTAGDSGTSTFALTASEQSQTLTIAIAPASGSESGGDCLPSP